MGARQGSRGVPGSGGTESSHGRASGVVVVQEEEAEEGQDEVAAVQASLRPLHHRALPRHRRLLILHLSAGTNTINILGHSWHSVDRFEENSPLLP